MQEKNTYQFEFMAVLAFILKWKKQLAIVTVGAAAIAYIGSGPIFITPKYKSGCVFYPTTVNTVSAYLFYNTKDRGRDLLEFGDEEIAEQYLQILNSGELAGRIINRYKLAEHYKVPASHPQQMDIVFKKFSKNTTISRTNYNAIEVTVLDENPQMAADLANAIMGMVDTIRTEVQRKVAIQAYNIVEKTYNDKLTRMDSIKTRLKEIASKGVYNSVEQSKGLSEVVGKGQQNSFTNQERKVLGEYNGEYIMLEELLKYEAENLADLSTRFEQAKVDVARNMSNIFVISQAYVPQTKAYPIRSIIVVLSAIGAFLTACIAIVILEKYNNLKSV